MIGRIIGLALASAFTAMAVEPLETGQLDNRQTVLKLVFISKLRYARNEGFRTPNFSLPFKMLGGFSGAKNGMVGGERVELPTSSV